MTEVAAKKQSGQHPQESGEHDKIMQANTDIIIATERHDRLHGEGEQQ